MAVAPSLTNRFSTRRGPRPIHCARTFCARSVRTRSACWNSRTSSTWRNPRLSHHLKILSRAGLVATRRDGNGIYYRRAQPKPDCAIYDYLVHLYATLDGFEADHQRANGAWIDVHAERAERSRKFFVDHADEFATQRELISTPVTYVPALRELLDGADCGRKRALDVGPGDGETLLVLADQFDYRARNRQFPRDARARACGDTRQRSEERIAAAEGLRIAQGAAPGSDSVRDGSASRSFSATVLRARRAAVERSTVCSSSSS